MIEVVGLTKVYGRNTAVDNLTFNARQGEILGFLGPNGAGKTTTMRILTGYMPPSAGTATVGGKDVVEESLAVRRMTGYLPETVPLYPDMRVSDYLEFMGRLRGARDLETRVPEVLEQVGLSDRSRSFIAKLSKGMRQRLGLAQALVHRPEVLILDEPTIGLDPAQIIEVRKLIQEIGREKTVILSTHILSEAQQICDRVLIVNHGRLVVEDTPHNLQQRLADRQKVTVQVAGDPAAALPLLKGLPDILKAAVNGRGLLEVEGRGGTDIRPQLVAALTAAGIPVLEIYAGSASLEEIFLQLVRDEAADPGEGEPAPKKKKAARGGGG